MLWVGVCFFVSKASGSHGIILNHVNSMIIFTLIKNPDGCSMEKWTGEGWIFEKRQANAVSKHQIKDESLDQDRSHGDGEKEMVLK